MKSYKINILLLIAFLINCNYFSQESQKDFQVWTNLESEAGINKRWMVHVQQQTRFIENASTYAYSYFDLGGLYRFSRNLRFTFNYIYVDKKRVDISYSYRHQFEGYFTYRKKIGKFVFFDRLLGDMQFKDYNADAQGNRLRDFYVRNKFTVRYKLPFKFTPYLAEETYYKFDGMYYEKGFNRIRIFGGLLYNLTDLWLAEVFYMMEFNHDAKTPTNNYVLSFGIVRTFFQ
ncbi:MAG: hypothetical protein JWO32_1874 [Bacteroidetes bacterium]|nr:hypothetical protein [Bacteroidota bacterium]